MCRVACRYIDRDTGVDTAVSTFDQVDEPGHRPIVSAPARRIAPGGCCSYTSRTGDRSLWQENGTMQAAKQFVLRHAALQILAIAALLIAAPLAHAVGEGCTPATHVFCVTNANDTMD